MHSSQIYTEGPAMSFFTSSWLLPQNEHRSSSFELSFLCIRPSLLFFYCLENLSLCNDPVNKPVLESFLAVHEKVPLGVLADPFQRLPRMFCKDFMDDFLDLHDLFG